MRNIVEVIFRCNFLVSNPISTKNTAFYSSLNGDHMKTTTVTIHKKQFLIISFEVRMKTELSPLPFRTRVGAGLP